MARPKIKPEKTVWIKFWMSKQEQDEYRLVLNLLKRRRQDDLRNYINKLVADSKAVHN